MQKNLTKAIINEIKDAVSNVDSMDYSHVFFEEKFDEDFEEAYNEIRTKGIINDGFFDDEPLYEFIGDEIPNKDRDREKDKIHNKYRNKEGWAIAEERELKEVDKKFPPQYEVDDRLLNICKTMTLKDANEAFIKLFQDEFSDYSIISREDVVDYIVESFFECNDEDTIQSDYEDFAEDYGRNVNLFAENYEKLQKNIAAYGLE